MAESNTRMHLQSALVAAQQLYGFRTDIPIREYIPRHYFQRYLCAFNGENGRGNIKYLEKFIDLLVYLECLPSDYEICQLRLQMDNREDWLEHLYVQRRKENPCVEITERSVESRSPLQ